MSIHASFPIARSVFNLFYFPCTSRVGMCFIAIQFSAAIALSRASSVSVCKFESRQNEEHPMGAVESGNLKSWTQYIEITVF